MDVNKKFSEKVIRLSFIGAILVVYVHSVNIETYNITSGPILILEKLINTIGRAAVPFFFFVSGFFITTEKNTFATILKKRFKSIFLPYIFYNIIYTVLFLVLSILFANVMKNPTTEIDWINGIFFHKYNVVGWFALQLFLYTPFTPLLRLIFLKSKIFSIIFLISTFTLAAFNIENEYVRPMGIFFYSLGIFAKLYYANYVTNIPLSNKKKILLALAFFSFAEMYYWCNFGDVKSINIIFRLPMMCSLFLLGDFVKMKLRYFMGFTFFIYLAHPYILGILKKVIYIKLYPYFTNNSLFILLDFFIPPILTIAILSIFISTLDRIYNNLPYPLQILYQSLNGFRKNRVNKATSSK